MILIAALFIHDNHHPAQYACDDAALSMSDTSYEIRTILSQYIP